MTIFVGRFKAPPHHDDHHRAGGALMRVAVLSGGPLERARNLARLRGLGGRGPPSAGHEVIAVLLERDGRWTHDNDEVVLRADGGLLEAEVAFPVLHGPFGEDGTVQGLLECLDLPYVGPGVLAASLAIDKLVFKRLLAFDGIPQVDFCEAGGDGWREHAATMGLPLWVKPARLGSSVGISKVTSPESGLRRGGGAGAPPRPAGDRRGRRRRQGGGVLRARKRRAADLAAGRDRRPRRLVRLRGQVLRGRHGADRPGPDRRRRRRLGFASWRRGSFGDRRFRAWPAATSSSATTARSWSTS